jgi:hypothetical protein
MCSARAPHFFVDQQVTRLSRDDKMMAMSPPGGASGRAYARKVTPSKLEAPRPSARILPLDTTAAQRTVLGLGGGVPVAPSFLALEDEETVAYDARDVPAVSLPALLAQCGRASSTVPSDNSSPGSVTTSEVRARSGSFHTVPEFPNDSSPAITVSAESNLHEIADNRIIDTLSPREGSAEWIQLRLARSSHPPSGVAVVPSARPSPSRRRSLFPTFVFAMVTMIVALLVASELSAAGKLPPGLDPRPLLTKGMRLAQDKIPWERVRRIAGR